LPFKPATPCHHPGCPMLVNDGPYCQVHKKQVNNQYDAMRGSPSERGYDTTWVKLRAAFLSEHPLCFECERHSRLTPASEVHHILPIDKYPELRLDKGNFMALCKPCHSVFTNKKRVKA